MKKMIPGTVNEIEAEVTSATDEDGKTEFTFDEKEFLIPTEKKYEKGERVILTVDPKAAQLCDPDDASFFGTLDSVVWKGSHYEMILISPYRRWLIKSQMDEQAGSEVGFTLAEGSLSVKGEGK